jgi:hypothetical protein
MDPGEHKNLINSSLHKAAIQQMKSKLLDLRNQYDDHEPAGELK